VCRHGRDGRSDLTNVQCKAIHNCYNESPLYNKYILIKMEKKKKLKIVLPYGPAIPLLDIFSHKEE
jgi:hypothetical protein